MEVKDPRRSAGDVPQEDTPMPMTAPQDELPEGLKTLLQAVWAVEVHATQMNLSNVSLLEENKRLKLENDLLKQDINDLRMKFGLVNQTVKQTNEGELRLPEPLNTEKALKAFSRAQEKGYLRVESNSRMRWLGTGKNKRFNASELAYFCGLVFDFKGLIRNQTGLANQYANELMKLFHTESQLYKLYDQVEDSKKTRPWIKAIEDLLKE